MAESDQAISISIDDGYIYGWGIQNEQDRPPDIRQLRGMHIEASTQACQGYKLGDDRDPDHLVDAGEMWEGSGAPKFICAYPRRDVGLCTGDSGGNDLRQWPT